MHPHYFPGLAALSRLGMGLLTPARQRTDADRLRDIDLAEERHLAKLANPAYIAAQKKRERKRLKLLEVHG